MLFFAWFRDLLTVPVVPLPAPYKSNMRQGDKFRIVTYNVHKCVGVDRRLNPTRIVSVLKEINADIVALQEVLCVQGRDSQSDQAHFIARELGFNYCMGHNRILKEGIYGNLVLSRFPLLGSEN